MYPHARLAAVPARRLVRTSTIDPDSSADPSKRKNAKSTGQRSDDLWESMYEFNESDEKLLEAVTSTQPRPFRGEEWGRSPESARFADSTRPNYRARPEPSSREESGFGRFSNSYVLPLLAPKPTDQDLSDHLSGVLQNTRSPESLNHLLDSIKPALPELEEHQFAIVYEALNDQARILKERRIIMSLYKFGELLRESSGFAALLNQTNSKIEEINAKSLRTVFKFLRRVSQNPDSEIIRNVTEQIGKRLDELNLDLVSESLLNANLYSRDFPASGQLWRFRASLLENCRRRILNDELEPNNFKQLNILFFNFLINCQNGQAFDMLDRLTRTLLSDFELDFSRSISLLSSIISSLRGTREEKEQYPAILSELIEKCNSTVYETLKADPEATDNYYAYLDLVHRHRSRLYSEFPNFFDPKLLDLLGPLLTREHEASRKGRRPILILNLVHNYSNVNTFNEKLIEFTSQLICNGAIPLNRLRVTDYFMLSKYRFPFVNYQQLLNVLKSSHRFLYSLKTRDRYQALLCDLILNEVNDPGMLSYLNQSMSYRPDEPIFQSRTVRLLNYERTVLARVVLSMFGQMEDKELEAKVKRTLQRRFHQLCIGEHRAHISVKYLSVDSRLQHPCYLSNGVLIDVFGIYDKSIGDLVPLEQFRSKFEEVNSIPLTASQEL